MIEVWDAISVIETANRRMARALKESALVRLHAEDGVDGVVEHVGYFTPPYGVILVIDGSPFECTHRDLREAILELRPRVGERISISNHGKRGSAYMYTVAVHGDEGERGWQSWAYSDPEDEALDLGWLRDEVDTERRKGADDLRRKAP